VSVNPGYANSTDKQNPFYAAFGLTTAGAPATTNNKPNNYFVKTILGANDPRLSRFYAAPVTGTDYGSLGGSITPVVKPVIGTEIGPGLAGSATQDQFILPSFESLFLQAEAAARGWITTSTPQALFESGIKESFRWLKVTTTNKTLLSGVALTDSLSGAYMINVNVPSAQWANAGTTVASQVKFIAYQKYIALCGIDAVESWTDLRRGVLVLPAGYLSNNADRAAKLPNVLPYAQTEITTNSVSLPARTDIFTEKLFWQP
jgi:hypothetical protein